MECSQLIWDYMHGEIVCADNGEVIGPIYDYGPVYERPETREWIRVKERKRKRYEHQAYKFQVLKRRLRRRYRLLRLAQSITSKGYVVDYDKLFSTERFVFTVYSKKSLEVLDWFEKKGLRPVLDKILSVLMDVEPVILARTLRGRYLLAYLVYEFLQGREPTYSELEDLQLIIGSNTFTRLKRTARSIVFKYKEVLKEAINNE